MCEVDEAEIVPGDFVLGIDFGGALQEHERNGQIAVVGGGAGALDQIVGLHVGRRNGRSGNGAFDGELLGEIGADGAAEGFVVGGASDGKFVLMEDELAAGGEHSAFNLVGRLVLGVVALQREGQRRVRGVLRGQLQA